MTRIVTVTLEVDPTEYHEAEDTPTGTVELVKDMLRGYADLPDNMIVSCDGIMRHFDK
jgi:hypothetical protein